MLPLQAPLQRPRLWFSHCLLGPSGHVTVQCVCTHESSSCHNWINDLLVLRNFFREDGEAHLCKPAVVSFLEPVCETKLAEGLLVHIHSNFSQIPRALKQEQEREQEQEQESQIERC